MNLQRLLAAGLVVSIVAHAAASAVFAPAADEMEIAASEGDAVAFVGSLEDLVAGVDTPTAAVAQASDTARPVEPDQATTPVEPSIIVPAEAPPAEIPPVVRGVTDVRPVTAETLSPAPSEPIEAMPAASVEAAVEPAQSPVAEVSPATPVEPREADPVPAETVTPPLKPAEAAEAAPVEPAVAEARPVDTKEAPREVRKQEPKTTKKRGGKHSSRKGGERASAASDRSSAEGRKAATTRDGGDKARSRYEGKVQARLRRAQRYPREARPRKLEGTATVGFTVVRSGAVTGIRLLRSSGHDILDTAALDVVRRAAPMPPIPDDVGRPEIRFTVPIRFTLR